MGEMFLLVAAVPVAFAIAFVWLLLKIMISANRAIMAWTDERKQRIMISQPKGENK